MPRSSRGQSSPAAPWSGPTGDTTRTHRPLLHRRCAARAATDPCSTSGATSVGSARVSPSSGTTTRAAVPAAHSSIGSGRGGSAGPNRRPHNEVSTDERFARDSVHPLVFWKRQLCDRVDNRKGTGIVVPRVGLAVHQLRGKALEQTMTPADIIWLFFLFSAVQPWLRQQYLEASRQRLIAKIERQRKSRVIILVHRQETMSILGFPVFRYIDVNDSEEVLRAIHLTDPAVPLDIVLHTPGGLVLSSLQIARAIHKHQGKVTAFVPHYAMSGGILIALAATEIVMSEYAVIGPVDPQLGQYPAASILKAVARKPVADVDDETLILADQAEKAVSQVRESVQELLADKCPREKAAELARLLSEGTWTHDHPITFETAKSFGLPVRSDLPPEFLDLMTLFPQPVRRQPTVEYLPGHRGANGVQGAHD